MDVVKIITDAEKEINQYYQDLVENKILGWTCGFSRVDEMVGRIKRGKLYIVGGHSGTGKSYFLINMLEGLIREAKEYKNDEKYTIPKVAVFSTELSTSDYMIRHILLRMGYFQLDLELNRDIYPEKLTEFKKHKEQYFAERLMNPYLPMIIGSTMTYEDIMEKIEGMEVKPDIVMLDYIQELSVTVNGRVLIEENEIMPVLSARFSRLAKETGIAFVYFSQVNNYSLAEDSKKVKTAPFSNGKQLNQTADVSLLLNREKVNNVYSPLMDIEIFKARHGRCGRVGCEIQDGFGLKQLTKDEAEKLADKFHQMHGYE